MIVAIVGACIIVSVFIFAWACSTGYDPSRCLSRLWSSLGLGAQRYEMILPRHATTHPPSVAGGRGADRNAMILALVCAGIVVSVFIFAYVCC